METLIPAPADVPAEFRPLAAGPSVSALITSMLAMTQAEITAAILLGGGAVWATRVLTSAEVCTLNTVPIAIVAGVTVPANRVVQPLYSVMQQRVGAAIYSAAPSFRGRWAGIVTDIVMVDAMTNTAGTYVYFLNALPDASTPINTTVDGLAMEMSSTADRTLGSGTVTQTVGYQVVPAL